MYDKNSFEILKSITAGRCDGFAFYYEITLCLYLCTILEIENQPAVFMGCDCVNNRQPETIIKFSERFVLLRKAEHKGTDTVRLCFSLRFYLFQHVKAVGCPIVAFHQGFIPCVVFFLVKRGVGIFSYALAGKLRYTSISSRNSEISVLISEQSESVCCMSRQSSSRASRFSYKEL